MDKKECLNCITEFEPVSSKQLYCSASCKVAYNRKKKLPVPPLHKLSDLPVEPYISVTEVMKPLQEHTNKLMEELPKLIRESLVDPKTVKLETTDAQCIEVWQNMIREFKNIIKGNPKPEKVAQLLNELSSRAARTMVLAPRQVEGIMVRCHNYLTGNYGLEGKAYNGSYKGTLNK